MSDFEGFFTLRTPADLLKKLKWDLSRVLDNPVDEYAAFDFFVTAEHLLDWHYPDSAGPGSKTQRTKLRSDEPLLRVTSHLANGAKHFKATARHHQSIGDVHVHNGAFSSDFCPLGFDTDSLVVELMGDDASSLGSEIRTVDLAQRVLDYWESELGST